MRNLHQFRSPPAIVTLLAVAGLPSAALAQDINSPSTQESFGDSPLLEEIIVTATRREADVQSVPLSVYVATEEALARLGATGFADYARTVPGLTFTQGSDGEEQTIRGISTSTWFEINPATAIYLDEVPLTNAGNGVGPPYNPDPMLVDINRIEVLRGPQGTLFGASAMGGAIRIITNEPDLSQAEGFVDAMVSSTKDGELGYGFHGMFNLPLNEGRSGIRAVGYQRDLGGFINSLDTGKKNVNNRELTGVRLSGTVLLSDNANLTGRVVYQDRQSDGSDRQEPIVGPRKQDRIHEPRRDKWANYNLVLDVDLSWSSLLSSTSFLDRTVDTRADVSAFLDFFFGVTNPMTVVNKVDVNEFVQEVRLVSNGDNRFKWLAGVFYQDQEQHANQDFPSPGFDALTGGLASMFGPPDNLNVGRDESTLEQVALYGELSYQIADLLEFSAGVRWFNIDRHFISNRVGLLFVRGQATESGSAGESGVTPKFSLSYAVSEELTLYSTVAEGFRPGGVNPIGGSVAPECLAELATLGFSEFPISYDSDSLWSYEVGTKWRKSDRRLQLNAALYHIDWSDMQTSKLLNCGVGFFQNAGEVDGDGIEIELVSHPIDNLDIIVAANYNKTELGEDVPNLGGSAGDRVPGVPRFNSNLGVSYFFPAFGGHEAFIHGDYQYVGSSYNDFNPVRRLEMPSYSITNFRIGLNAQQWSTAFFVNNVFDESGILFVQNNILGRSIVTTRPRMIGISTTWRF